MHDYEENNEKENDNIVKNNRMMKTSYNSDTK